MASCDFSISFSPRRRPALSRLAGVLLAAGFVLGLAGGLRAQQSSPAAPDALALFNNAIAAFDRGDYPGAVTLIGDLLKQIPADLPPADKAKLNAQLEPIYFTLGAAHFNLKQYPEAITAIKDYLARYPRSGRATDAAFSLAQASYFSKDYPAAAQGFAALENTAAVREQALLFEGLSYREAGDNAKAVAALEKLTAPGIKSPVAARGAMQLLGLYSQQKQPEKTLKTLAAIQASIGQLENVVELNAVALEQGDTFLQTNANQEALACYRAVRTREQVIALEHDRIDALQKRVEANKAAARANPREAAQYSLAARQLQASIAEDQTLLEGFEKLPPIYPKVLYRIGRAFSQMGRPWEAVVAFQDSLDRSSDPADREPALFGIITSYAEVNQGKSARAACDQYLQEFPKGANAYTVGYLLGATALQEGDPAAAEAFFGRILDEQPGNTMREEMRFLVANALFAQGKYDDARSEYSRYQQDFPKGSHYEEAVYRLALGNLFTSDYDAARKGLEDYLNRYPSGNFVSDGKYRLAVCKYAANQYDEVIADMTDWLKKYPGDAQQGEVNALLGDAYAATGKTDEALAAYQTSYKQATTDEALNYSLTEAGKILQKRGDWAGDSAMYEEFVRTHSGHPSVVMALAQIGRAKVKQGKADEAKRFFADTLKDYIDDRSRGSIEQILDQLALLCVRKKPAASAASPSPDASPAATPEPGAELDELLGASLTDRSPTAQARILYAKAQLARFRRQDAEAGRGLLDIAAKFKPGALSPTILGQVGDALLSKGRVDDAAPFYQELMDRFPKSENVDFAYAGLGEIAFQKKQYDKAMEFFEDGANKIAVNQKLKDLTVGQAKTLLALGKLDEAKKIFEQTAGVREWRGETTAFCVYSLGEIEAKKGHWAEASAYYQRVYVGYQRFLTWVAKSYLGSADCLEKLGKKQDAVRTYQEMLRNPKLSELAEAAVARQRLQALGAG